MSKMMYLVADVELSAYGRMEWVMGNKGSGCDSGTRQNSSEPKVWTRTLLGMLAVTEVEVMGPCTLGFLSLGERHSVKIH